MEDLEISKDVLKRYLDRRLEEIKEMKRYLLENRYNDIMMFSHKIMGSAATFGLKEIGDTAEQIESKALSSAKDEVSNLIEKMESEVHSAINRLG